MSDDLIKRNSVIATIERMYEVCTTGDITDYRDLMLESVKVLPSADRPQGEWIDYKDEHTCSVCKEVVIGDWDYEYERYDYCPNCGAKMKGADDE